MGAGVPGRNDENRDTLILPAQQGSCPQQESVGKDEGTTNGWRRRGRQTSMGMVECATPSLLLLPATSLTILLPVRQGSINCFMPTLLDCGASVVVNLGSAGAKHGKDKVWLIYIHVWLYLYPTDNGATQYTAHPSDPASQIAPTI